MQQLILLLSCTSSPPAVEEGPAPATQPAPPADALAGRLFWVSESSGRPQTLSAPAGKLSEATPVPLEGAVFPAEPDPLGTHALFVRSVEAPHRESLWLGGEGDAATQLGGEATAVRNPSWAPDGSFIVYESNHESFRDLYRVGRNGEGPARLTEAEHGSFEPDVGPDGRIVFVSSRDGDAEVYVMGAKGSHQTRLTEVHGDDMKPTWKPDGSEITWLARRDLVVQTWRMDPDGGNARPFRAEPVQQQVARELVWAPDGERLAVTVQLGPTEVAIDVLDASGKRIARIDGPGADEHPAWSPDSRHLAFSSQRDGQAQPDLYVVDRDGEGLERLTTDEAADWLPRWAR